MQLPRPECQQVSCFTRSTVCYEYSRMVEEHLYPIKDRGSLVAVLLVYEGIMCPFLDVHRPRVFQTFLV